MRLTKSLLFVISALALATGAAFAGDPFAGEPSIPYSSSVESSNPELLSDAATLGSEQFSEPMNASDALALEESDATYLAQPGEYLIYEETVVLVPSESSEMPG